MAVLSEVDPTQDPSFVGDPNTEDTSVQDPETEQPTDPNNEENDDEENNLLLDVFRYAEREDEDLRFNLIRTWKRNDYYFNNIQRIYFDDTARDYRSIDAIADQLASYSGIDDIKTINIYRATAESLVAALSVSTPAVEFTPDDAENPEDLQTATAYDKISEVVSRHNHAQLMLIKALVLLYNCGVIAAYNHYKTDEEYGYTETPAKTATKPQHTADIHCATCGETIDTNVDPQQINPQAPVACPTCHANLPPHIVPKIEYVDEVTEYTRTPKGRALFDIFGPTFVKLPLYARNQAGCGYLILRVEDHIAKFKTVYKDHAEDIGSGGGDTYSYERWGRIPPEYYGTMPKDMATLRTGWIRPWYFRSCLDEDDAQMLTDKYPDGIMMSVINDTVVEKSKEKLDSRWTVSFDPRANFIHAEPDGNAMIPLQDSENDIFNLGLQSIEYGIPETYVHPKTVDLKKYKNTKSAPGMMSPAMPPGPDKTLSDGFYQSKPATLSSEYTNFAQTITAKHQYVSGAVPSLFGGTAEGQPQTATQYTESRNRALQRRQLVWQMINVFWCQLISKTVKDYASNIREDESYATKQNGTFVNVWIRTSELQGKVGHVEPETNGQIPQTWSQKKDFLMSLIALIPQSPILGTILLDPNNSEILKQTTGMPDFYIPGEADRDKQWAEFFKLSQAAPLGQPQDPNNPASTPQEPSIKPDLDVDDHDAHMKVLKNILVSPIGMQLYETNPAGYQNCIAHYRMHQIMLQAHTMGMSQSSPEGQAPKSATDIQG